MSHETHHHPATETTKTPFTSAFWFVIILAGLFIAAVNFVNVMGHDSEEGHGGGHEATEAHHPAAAGAASEHGHETEAGAAMHAEDTSMHHENAPAAEATHTEGH